MFLRCPSLDIHICMVFAGAADPPAMFSDTYGDG
jgi:hypothetical protein